jgi:hypothetical protein
MAILSCSPLEKVVATIACEEVGKVYFVPPEEVGTNEGSLRVEPTANNQSKSIRWAEDYEIFSILQPVHS